VNGRVVSTYLGCGPAADETAQRAAEKSARRTAARAELAEIIQMNQEGLAQSRLVRRTIHATYLANGYHQHKGQWRKRRPKRTPTLAPELVLQPSSTPAQPAPTAPCAPRPAPSDPPVCLRPSVCLHPLGCPHPLGCATPMHHPRS